MESNTLEVNPKFVCMGEATISEIGEPVFSFGANPCVNCIVNFNNGLFFFSHIPSVFDWKNLLDTLKTKYPDHSKWNVTLASGSPSNEMEGLKNYFENLNVGNIELLQSSEIMVATDGTLSLDVTQELIDTTKTPENTQKLKCLGLKIQLSAFTGPVEFFWASFSKEKPFIPRPRKSFSSDKPFYKEILRPEIKKYSDF